MRVEQKDIFLSYKSEFRTKAERLRNIFLQNGKTVHFDTNLPPGQRWDQELQTRLDNSRCVLALWTKLSNQSDVQYDEAKYGLSHGTLILARLDDCEFPLGFQGAHHADLSSWDAGEAHPEIAKLMGRVFALIAADHDNAEPIGEISRQLTGKPDSADRHSVSDRSVDKYAILSSLPEIDASIRGWIENGYDSIMKARNEALLTLDDEAPREFFRRAADNFRRALGQLTSAQVKRAPEGTNTPIDYFLRMELANSMVFSGTSDNPVQKEAFEIFEALAKSYPNDTAVFLRLGIAKVKEARTRPFGSEKRDLLRAAIRDLSNALSLAPQDPVVDQEHWVYFEAPLQIGVCFWVMSEFPGTPEAKRRESLSQAILNTIPVIGQSAPQKDEDGWISFIRMRAFGNLIYFLSLVARNTLDASTERSTIRQGLDRLLEKDAWTIVRNQVRIIDSILFAASTIGDWLLARRMAQTNVDNFKKRRFQN